MIVNNRDVYRARRFRQFHKDNPHVYKLLLKYARNIKQNPHIQRWGIRNLWEKLRWDLAVKLEVLSDDDYKLNDHYPPYYARMMIRDYPDEFKDWLDIRGTSCQLPEGV
jgi:hypothetical protein